ncbi:MAG: sulfate/molybdate ABC transporter ATP-binding protein [Dehalococcoidia bacterium]|nr:sulfate/molybdate ABC transporter ATP-binding protein [Dehalococcoidia bacterium]
MSVLVKNLVKKFGAFGAVNGASFEIKEGDLAALLGPSGAGKSTILRVIAGLEKPDSGLVQLDGVDASNLSPQKRGVGFVFQNYALFKHMTIANNIAFGLAVRKTPKKETEDRVKELLNLVKLEGYGNHYPSQLSGGQRQRVALARALAPRPKVMLLDEPFGALDAQVRQELREWIRRLHDEVHVTSIFVTHDQEEALEISDRIVVLNKGLVEQIGTPKELYDHPATAFVASFIGPVNMLRGEAARGMATVGGGMKFELPGSGSQTDGSVAVFIRPYDFDLSRSRNAGASVQAKIQRVMTIGGNVKLNLSLNDGHTIEVQVGRDYFETLLVGPGDDVWVTPKVVKVFSQEGEAKS